LFVCVCALRCFEVRWSDSLLTGARSACNGQRRRRHGAAGVATVRRRLRPAAGRAAAQQQSARGAHRAVSLQFKTAHDAVSLHAALQAAHRKYKRKTSKLLARRGQYTHVYTKKHIHRGTRQSELPHNWHQRLTGGPRARGGAAVTARGGPAWSRRASRAEVVTRGWGTGRPSSRGRACPCPGSIRTCSGRGPSRRGRDDILDRSRTAGPPRSSRRCRGTTCTPAPCSPDSTCTPLAPCAAGWVVAKAQG
jgi:hypothetical protein